MVRFMMTFSNIWVNYGERELKLNLTKNRTDRKTLLLSNFWSNFNCIYCSKINANFAL